VNLTSLCKLLIKQLCKNTICWEDFQQLMDTESVLREEILDFVMFGQQINLLEIDD
jgi:hypothetical protein